MNIPDVYLPLLLLAVPLTVSIFIAFFLRSSGGFASFLSVGAAVAIAAIAGHIIFRTDAITANMPWLTFGDFSLSLGFLINDLAKLMLTVVAFVGLLIHIFSLGYMKGDPSIARFFGAMTFFMFSMIGLTVADDLVMLFIFWELVGLSSYLLIGFYLHKPSAVAAANKAFIVNRIGDFGFIIGIVWAYWHFGTVSLTGIEAAILRNGVPPETWIALLLFCGAIGKSGQMPLHVWLPDAMEGPTPVSALIHAATMVAAGIYLLCRISVVMTADALDVVLFVGATTALYAGLCALTQKDIKKILAYSTVSQLGYMVSAFALGSMLALEEGGTAALAGITGGVAAAMFHLTTHAFFKALLFLGAGSVIHSCHHEQNIFRMGGLWNKMPITFITFSVGFLALIGFPFLSGFFSKDAILLLAREVGGPAFWVLAVGALFTALYMTRLWIIVFFGRPKTDAADMTHESPAVMWVPLAILAALAAAGGVIGFYPEPLASALNHVPHAEGSTHWMIVGTSLVVLVVGMVAAFAFYRAGARDDRLEQNFRPLYRFLSGRLWFDEIYNGYVALVQDRFARLLAFLEQILLSGGLVRGSAAIAGVLGIFAKGTHTGNLNTYAYWFFAGLAAIWLVVFGF